MSDADKGKRGWRRRGRQAPPAKPAGFSRPPEPDRPNGPQEHGNGERGWRRNHRRREPSTPENSWLATQPEFQRYWGEPGEADHVQPPPIEPPSPEPQVEQPPPPPQNAPRPRQRLRRKPADLSTLMARYTARAEEQENFAPPRPSRRQPPPPPEPPVQEANPQNQPRQSVPAPRPVPVRKKTADPKFFASPLPAEAPEAEPGRPARADRNAGSQKPAPAQAPGSMIVSDGQVKIVESGTDPIDNEPHDDPQAEEQMSSAEIPAQPPVQPSAPVMQAPPVESGHNVTDTIPQYLPSDDPDHASVSIRPAAAEAEVEAEGQQLPELAAGEEHDIDWRDRDPDADPAGNAATAPEPRYEPAYVSPEPIGPPQLPPPIPGYSPDHGPVRFDGPLPYQRSGHEAQGPNLADWDAANERLDFEPAWHARRGGGGFGRKFLFALVLLGLVGAGGYGIWSGKAGQLLSFAANLMTAPGGAPELNEEPVISRAPDVAATRPEPFADTASPAASATATDPAAPSTVTLAPASRTPVPTAPALTAKPGDRVAPDPNMTTRQIEGPTAQTTTLWWKAKTVTRFPALTPAELAGQPKLPSARGESVMAPSGPIPGAGAVSGAGSSVNAAEIARIDELIQSFAIGKADDAITPLLAAAPGDVSLLMLSGRTALAKSSNLEALAIFDKVLAAEPANLDARTARGRALVNLGRATEARTIAAEVLAANPNHLGALWLSVEAQASTGALEAALEVCGRLEAAGAEPGSADWCRGVANKRARRPLQAETLFVDALQAGTRDFVAMRQLYFRFKGYYNGKIDGFSSDDLLNAATRCTALRDCNTAGI